MPAKVFGLGLIAAVATPAGADDVRVLAASAGAGTNGYVISVTLAHTDTGWDDYADAWEVLDSAGARLGLRGLLHPHVNEQPFTGALMGVVIPDGAAQVFIRACTNVDGWGEALFPLTLD